MVIGREGAGEGFWWVGGGRELDTWWWYGMRRVGTGGAVCTSDPASLTHTHTTHTVQDLTVKAGEQRLHSHLPTL